MDKKAMIDRIVAQKAAGFDEGAREWLEALGDGQVAKIHALCAAPAAAGSPEKDKQPAAAAGADKGDPEKPDPEKKEPVVSAAAAEPAKAEPEKPKSDDEVIAMLSPQGREMYTQMRKRFDEETAGLIQTIVANSGGLYTTEQLDAGVKSEKYTRDDLEKLAALSKPKPDFTGRGVAAHDATPNGGNAATTAPRMPAITIGRKTAAA